MSTSTTLSHVSLPPTFTRPALHDGRADTGELIKLANQQRALLAATYRAVFAFTTPGDGAAHVAWQAQLDDGDAWFAQADIVATSAAGDGGAWRRQTLLTRNGATVTIVSDVFVTATTTAALAAFNVTWSVSSLYAQLNLTDAVATPGTWKVALEIVKP